MWPINSVSHFNDKRYLFVFLNLCHWTTIWKLRMNHNAKNNDIIHASCFSYICYCSKRQNFMILFCVWWIWLQLKKNSIKRVLCDLTDCYCPQDICKIIANNQNPFCHKKWLILMFHSKMLLWHALVVILPCVFLSKLTSQIFASHFYPSESKCKSH